MVDSAAASTVEEETPHNPYLVTKDYHDHHLDQNLLNWWAVVAVPGDTGTTQQLVVRQIELSPESDEAGHCCGFDLGVVESHETAHGEVL